MLQSHEIPRRFFIKGLVASSAVVAEKLFLPRADQAVAQNSSPQIRLRTQFGVNILDSVDQSGQSYRFTDQQLEWLLDIFSHPSLQIFRDGVKNKTIAATHDSYNRAVVCSLETNRLADYFIGVHPEPRVFKLRSVHELMHPFLNCMQSNNPILIRLNRAFQLRGPLTNYARSRESDLARLSESGAEIPAAWFDVEDDHLRDTAAGPGGINPFSPQLIGQYIEYAEIAYGLFGPRQINPI